MCSKACGLRTERITDGATSSVPILCARRRAGHYPPGCGIAPLSTGSNPLCSKACGLPLIPSHTDMGQEVPILCARRRAGHWSLQSNRVHRTVPILCARRRAGHTCWHRLGRGYCVPILCARRRAGHPITVCSRVTSRVPILCARRRAGHSTDACTAGSIWAFQSFLLEGVRATFLGAPFDCIRYVPILCARRRAGHNPPHLLDPRLAHVPILCARRRAGHLEERSRGQQRGSSNPLCSKACGPLGAYVHWEPYGWFQSFVLEGVRATLVPVPFGLFTLVPILCARRRAGHHQDGLSRGKFGRSNPLCSKACGPLFVFALASVVSEFQSFVLEGVRATPW